MRAKSRWPFRKRKTAVKHYSRDIFLIYQLTAEDAPLTEAHIGDGRIYSISVTKIDVGGKREEEEKLYDISRDSVEAERILRIISRGKVFPSEAAEIVGDLISIMPL